MSSPGPRTLLFVYGTLKRGCSNHGFLAGERFVAHARTIPGFRLVDLGEYPGLVAAPGASSAVSGEVWAVGSTALTRLDLLEGTEEGLYRREPIALSPPFARQSVETYFYNRPVDHCPDIPDGTWTEG